MAGKIYVGNALEELRRLPADYVQMCVTSPAYYRLRQYGTGTWVGGDPKCNHRNPTQHQKQGATSQRRGRRNVEAQQAASDNASYRECKCGAIYIEPTIWDGEDDCDHNWGDQLRGARGRGNRSGDTSTSRLTNPKRQDQVGRATDGGAFCSECGAWRGGLGLEPTPELYVKHLVSVFREIKRVLRPDGVVFLNLGDSYASSGKGGEREDAPWIGNTARQAALEGDREISSVWGIKPKDRMLIPHRVAIALCDDGWCIRDEIVWHKNGMPESVTDRCCKSHEMIFMLTKKRRYFYDHVAIMESATFDMPSAPDKITSPHGQGFTRKATRGRTTYGRHTLGNAVPEEDRRSPPLIGRNSGNKERVAASARGVPVDDGGKTVGAVAGNVPWEGTTRVCRSVWKIGTVPFLDAHFAVFPPALPERCILAGTSEFGACPDCGAPWRRKIAKVAEADLAHQIACGSNADGEYHGVATKDYDAVGVQDPSAVKARILAGLKKKITLGWYPTCECASPPPLPKYPAPPKQKGRLKEWEAACRVIDEQVKAICEALMKATKPKPCIVLDAFGGAGTTALVADRLRRDFVLTELNPEYVGMTVNRLREDGGMLVDVEVVHSE